MYKKILLSILNKVELSYILWLFLEKLVKIGIGLVISFVVIKHLGPESFGFYNFYVNIGLIVFSVATLGLEGVTIKELLDYDSNKQTIIGTTFILRLCASLFALIAVILYAISYGYDLYLLVFISIGNIFLCSNVAPVYLQAFSKFKYLAYSGIITTITSCLFKVYLIESNKQLYWFVFTYMSELILNSLLNYFFLIKETNCKLNILWCKLTAKKLLLKSWPVCISIIVTSLTLRIDQLLINFLFVKERLGVYAVSSRITEATFFIPVILTTTLFPFFCKKYKSTNYDHIICRFYLIVNYISISCVIFISTFKFLGSSPNIYEKSICNNFPSLVTKIFSRCLSPTPIT